jgi:predicted metal-dependent hydrolase
MFGLSKPIRTKTRETLTLAGREYPYTLTVSRLARGVRLKISQQGLEVVIPHRFSLSRLPRLLHEKENWITGHLSRMAEQKKESAARLTDGAILHLFGEQYTLRFMPTIKKKPTIREARTLKYSSDHAEYAGREILVYSRAGHGSLDASGNPGAAESVKKELEAFFRKKAQQYFARRVPEIAAIMGTRHGRITVRGQQSRWGSCSRENNLNFNWRLIFHSAAVADYVIYHELAHTVHHNHSHRFYSLLERFCPDYKSLRKTLRRGHALM